MKKILILFLILFTNSIALAATKDVVPRANNEGAIGNSSYAWTEANIITITATGTLDIPSGTNPTIDSAGEIALDTTGTQLLVGTGSSTLMTISGTHLACITIEELAAADDDKLIMSPNESITLRNGWAVCVGTCTTEADIGLEVVDIGAGTVTAVTGTLFAEDQTTTRNVTSFTAGTAVGQGDLLRFNTGATNPSPETDDYILCFTYTEDRQ